MITHTSRSPPHEIPSLCIDVFSRIESVDLDVSSDPGLEFVVDDNSTNRSRVLCDPSSPICTGLPVTHRSLAFTVEVDVGIHPPLSVRCDPPSASKENLACVAM